MPDDKSSPQADGEHLLKLVDALTAVIVEENHRLAEGTPAALAATLGIKAQLAAEFERSILPIRTGASLTTPANLKLRQQLADRGLLLQQVTNENSVRLRAAMVSTRRRIDAIMRALRDADRRAGPYGADGRSRQSSGAARGLHRSV